MSQTRRLAAILAADVAGYSRLMGADEEGTLAALRAIRRELADPKIKERWFVVPQILAVRECWTASWRRGHLLIARGYS